METVESKIANWDHEINEASEPDQFNSTWVNSVMGECVHILENRLQGGQALRSPDVGHIEHLLEFINRMFSEILCVQHTFGCANGRNLCIAFKKMLAVQHPRLAELQMKTLTALISILKTVDNARTEYPCEDIYPRNVFDNIPRAIIELDLDYFVKPFYSSIKVDLVNKTAEFFYTLWSISTPKPNPQRILPFLEYALTSFNLQCDNGLFNRATALELLTWAVSTLNEITIDFVKKIRIFTARVFPSDLWTAEQKIDCLNLMEMCQSKTPTGLQDTKTKLTVEFPCIISMVHDAMANLDPLRFVAYLFKKNLKFSSLHIPEFERMADPAETSQITHLLYSLSFSLQNLLISATHPEQIHYIWDLSHQVIEYLLRLCKTDKHSIPYATFLKHIVLHSTTTFTIRKFVFQMIHPRDAYLELMKYLLSWTDALTLMALSGPPLQVDSFKAQNARISKHNSVTIILLECDGWLELLKRDGGQPGPGTGGGASAAAHVDGERKRIIRNLKSNIQKMLEVTGAWPMDFDTIEA